MESFFIFLSFIGLVGKLLFNTVVLGPSSLLPPQAAEIAWEKQNSESVVLGVTAPEYEYTVGDSVFVGNALQATISRPNAVKGAVVPHHLVGSALIADVYAQVSPDTQRVIVIGPDHHETGDNWASTSQATWNTPYGTVAADEEAISTLLQITDIELKPEQMSEEHSSISQMPFIAHYLPKAQVIPIMISSSAKIEQIELLVAALDQITDESTLVVGSVDFSHYLQSNEADEKDGITRGLIELQEYEQIMALNNDFLDSPPSVVAVMMLMEKRNSDMEIVNNTNSSKVLGLPAEPTTSYFEILWK